MTSSVAVSRGDIFLLRVKEQSADGVTEKERPALVIQNNDGNQHGSTTIVVFITTTIKEERNYPHVVVLERGVGGLSARSTVDCGIIWTVKKGNLGRKLGHVDLINMKRVDYALKVSLALT